MADRILFLENELKLKDLEITNLHSQLNLKDTIISLLRKQLNMPNEKAELETDEITKKLSSKQIKENLNKARPNAIEFCKFIKNEIYKDNAYFKVITFEKYKNNRIKGLKYFNESTFDAILPKTLNGIFDFSSMSNLVTNVVCSIIANADKSLCPLYCSDSHRKVFYIKTEEEGWKKISNEDLDSILYKIINLVEFAANTADFNVFKLFKYSNDAYHNIYPNGIKNEEVYDLKRSTEKIILCVELTPELKDTIAKHLKGELSKLVGDKTEIFKPIKNENIVMNFSVDDETNLSEEEY
jgi:hypothetical protein